MRALRVLLRQAHTARLRNVRVPRSILRGIPACEGVDGVDFVDDVDGVDSVDGRRRGQWRSPIPPFPRRRESSE